MATANSLIRIAFLGAESTGKTQLSEALATHLRARGQEVHWVGEYLRTWCDAQGRTPEPLEQAQIAQQQADAVLQHASGTVIADTTPLMTALQYSAFIGSIDVKLKPVPTSVATAMMA